ncbi:predicted protein [Francisella tularensis subsp. novicida GA99-3548]|uniref:Abi family protein n=1 Tax=Francisella tularensis TaxID=263 RepID=UPI000158B456|nr:Abi family protein [Francisella tularensis]AJI73228.1 abi-like family protein [Francisella tularensis subsp. novicida D9876]EDN38533.1 predicted protein [Francisella tularensis subsp. novicida GA99-3548]
MKIVKIIHFCEVSKKVQTACGESYIISNNSVKINSEYYVKESNKTVELLKVRKRLTYSEIYQKIVEEDQIIQVKDNLDTKLLESMIKHIGFYRLKGYIYYYRNTGNTNYSQTNGFTPSVKQVYKLYLFDKELRAILLKIIETIEISLRGRISHVLSQYGHGYHMSSLNYSKKFEKREIIHNWIGRNYTFTKKDNRSYIRNAAIKYGDYTPIWTSIECWDFGMIKHIFDIMSDKNRNDVATHYGFTPKLLNNWINVINDIRNKVAHHIRIFNDVTMSLSFKLDGRKKYLNKDLHNIVNNNHSITSVLLAMFYLLKEINLDYKEIKDSLTDLLLSVIGNDIISYDSVGLNEAILNKYFLD